LPVNHSFRDTNVIGTATGGYEVSITFKAAGIRDTDSLAHIVSSLSTYGTLCVGCVNIRSCYWILVTVVTVTYIFADSSGIIWVVAGGCQVAVFMSHVKCSTASGYGEAVFAIMKVVGGGGKATSICVGGTF
jgi:hypothetical protein